MSSPTTKNRQILLASRPSGEPSEENFKLAEVEIVGEIKDCRVVGIAVGHRFSQVWGNSVRPRKARGSNHYLVLSPEKVAVALLQAQRSTVRFNQWLRK